MGFALSEHREALSEQESAVLDFLLRPGQIEKEIRRKEHRIETLRSMAGRKMPRLEKVRVQSTPDPTRMQTLLAMAADEEKEIRDLEAEMERAWEEIALAISDIPDTLMIELLDLRYLQYRNWDEIARELVYSQGWLHKLHRRALSLVRLPA